jgi:hypothetical protein
MSRSSNKSGGSTGPSAPIIAISTRNGTTAGTVIIGAPTRAELEQEKSSSRHRITNEIMRSNCMNKSTGNNNIMSIYNNNEVVGTGVIGAGAMGAEAIRIEGARARHKQNKWNRSFRSKSHKSWSHKNMSKIHMIRSPRSRSKIHNSKSN